MLQKPKKKEQNERNENVIIRVTPKMKKRWSDLVHVLVGKDKRFGTANDLFEDMMDKYGPVIRVQLA